MRSRNFILTFIVLFICLATIEGFSSRAKSSERGSLANAGQINGTNRSSAAWQDNLNVFGSGTLTEDTASGLSYRVTVTVTAPSGRSNTTQSDWSPAPITHTTGLSIGVNDGTYNIHATFESQSGNYDEYGNFTGTGSIVSVGNSTNSTTVAPRVYIGGISPTTANVNQSASHSIRVSIRSTTGVPQNTQVAVEFLESSNFNDVVYSVVDRSKSVTINNPGTSKNVIFDLSVNPTSPIGEVRSVARIDSVTPTNIPGADTLSENISFTVIASPTSGGGCSHVPEPPEGYEEYCRRNWGETAYWDTIECRCKTTLPTGSPIVIDVSGNGFNLTNYANGISFDLNSDGTREQLSWTSANSDDAWLVFDRNANHIVDNGQELFGNFTPQPTPPVGEERQGFLALAEFDKAINGGNGDGKITRRDAIFRKLRLWQDRNHNGISEAEEVYRLPALDVVALFLDYQQSRRADAHGNQFKYRARVRDRLGANVGRWAWDVFLMSEQ